MGRIEKKFNALKTKGEKALVVYLTAGDPTLEKTKEIVMALDQAGVDIIEIGVPFSDPTADGPIIQAASQRALKMGTNLRDILKMIKETRKLSQIPIVLFGYYNPIYIYGSKNFADAAKDAGVDGILVVDLPPEEAQELRCYTEPLGIDFISLIAPTTDNVRIREIVGKASGFLYYISVTGVTGTAKPSMENVKTDVKRIRNLSKLPIVVGFGITSPKQAGQIAALADGIVIGSAIVKMIEENSHRKNLSQIVSSFARDVKKAIS
jgi:tryptophan synthase alpha chain